MDPVATLATFQNVGAHPMLYNLVFGESVLNDAVCVVLFQALLAHARSGTTGFGAMAIWHTLSQFMIIMVGSLLVGMFVGLSSAFVLLRTTSAHFASYEVNLPLASVRCG